MNLSIADLAKRQMAHYRMTLNGVFSFYLWLGLLLQARVAQQLSNPQQV